MRVRAGEVVCCCCLLILVLGVGSAVATEGGKVEYKKPRRTRTIDIIPLKPIERRLQVQYRPIFGSPVNTTVLIDEKRHAVRYEPLLDGDNQPVTRSDSEGDYYVPNLKKPLHVLAGTSGGEKTWRVATDEKKDLRYIPLAEVNQTLIDFHEPKLRVDGNGFNLDGDRPASFFKRYWKKILLIVFGSAVGGIIETPIIWWGGRRLDLKDPSPEERKIDRLLEQQESQRELGDTHFEPDQITESLG